MTGEEDIIKSYTYKMYKDFSDSTGTDVTVPENGTKRGGFTNSGRTVRLKHQELKTSRDRPRTCSIEFPRFFNIVKSSQALGQMLTANQPDTWKLDGGRSYPFVANTTKGVLPGYVSGAWVVSGIVTPTNADDTSQVGGTTTTKSGRKASA